MAAAVLDIPCLLDAELDSANPAADNGAAATIFMGMDAGGAKHHGLFSFPMDAVGAIPITRITAVQILLFVDTVLGTPGTHVQRLMAKPPTWTELANWTTYDGSNPWAAAGGDESATGGNITSGIIIAAQALQSLQILASVLPGFTAARAAGQTRFDLLIRRSNESGSSTGFTVRSSEHATVATRPWMRILHTFPSAPMVGGFQQTRIRRA